MDQNKLFEKCRKNFKLKQDIIPHDSEASLEELLSLQYCLEYNLKFLKLNIESRIINRKRS